MRIAPESDRIPPRGRRPARGRPIRWIITNREDFMAGSRPIVAAVSAVAFAVFYVVALFGVMDLPEGTDSSAAVMAKYTDPGTRAGLISGVYLLAAAGLAFVWFLASLRERLWGESGGGLATVAFASGVLYVAMLFVSGATFGVLPLAIAVGELDAQAIDPGLARVLVQLGFTSLLVYGLLAAAVMVAAASLAGLRADLLPRWLGLAGLVVALLLAFGPMYMPQLLVPLWAVAVGLALTRRSVTTLAREPTPA
jgi:hypothetical protein